MFDYLAQVAALAGYLSAIVTAALLLVKPLRQKFLGGKETVSGLKCLLRADMLSTYYRNHKKDAIRQYERENFDSEYKAYKAIGGNSFIDTLYTEVQKWEVYRDEIQ